MNTRDLNLRLAVNTILFPHLNHHKSLCKTKTNTTATRLFFTPSAALDLHSRLSLNSCSTEEAFDPAHPADLSLLTAEMHRSRPLSSRVPRPKEEEEEEDVEEAVLKGDDME